MNNWTNPQTFASVWDSAVAMRHSHTFLIFEAPDGTTTRWSYGDFDTLVDRVAHTLYGLGARPGHAVHLALTNSPTFVAVWLAAVKLGAWIVPSDPLGRAPELSGHIERTRPRVGICAATRAAEYRAAVAASAVEMAVIEIDEADAALEQFQPALPQSQTSTQPDNTIGIQPDIATTRPDNTPTTRPDNTPSSQPDGIPGTQPDSTLSIRPDVAFTTPNLRDRAAVMFTSGTTGRPKGVEITQANYAFAGKAMAEAAGLSRDDRQLVVLPLFHANAQYYSFASAIWAGASVALMSGFSASGFLAQAARHGATCASLFAAPIRMILARGAPPDERQRQQLRLRHCWYAQNISADQYATVTAWFGCRPRQLYGMTETIPAVLTDEAANPHHASMGRVTSGCEVDVQDRDGRSVAPGTVGEVVVRGERGITLFEGYLDAEEITAASFRDGWFLTGDRATRDNTGRHFFDGRHSEVLKVSGENVSVVELEAVLSEHPNVLEAAVVARPDEIRDEVPVAFVVAANALNPPTVAELKAWCAQHLSKSKQPHDIMLINELPRTSVGKIRKFLLTERAAIPDDAD